MADTVHRSAERSCAVEGMVYVVKILIDGRKKLEVYERRKDAQTRCGRIINPIAGGCDIKGGKDAFVEEARLLLVQTTDRRIDRSVAKKQVVGGDAEIVRDSAAERKEFKDSLDL